MKTKIQTQTAESQEVIDLIQGEFTLDEASEILHNLLYDKIAFHARRAHSLQERFGIETSHIDKRCEELKKIKGNLNQTLKDAAGGAKRLRLVGRVELIPVEDSAE